MRESRLHASSPVALKQRGATKKGRISTSRHFLNKIKDPMDSYHHYL